MMGNHSPVRNFVYVYGTNGGPGIVCPDLIPSPNGSGTVSGLRIRKMAHIQNRDLLAPLQVRYSGRTVRIRYPGSCRGHP